MKKILLALATTLLLPNMSFAAACADGANAAGCTIDTSAITYTLTGDIAPASGVEGIKFTSGATTNTTTLTGDISTTGSGAYGLLILTSDSNTTTLTGDISTTGTSAYGLFLSNSDSNTTNITGNISTIGYNAFGLYLNNTASNNTTTLTGNITTTGEYSYGLVFVESDSNTTTLTGDISTTGERAIGLLLSSSDSNTTTIVGNISTGSVDGVTGTSAYGIYLYGSHSNTTTLTGNITTSGSLGFGLQLDNSSRNTTTLTGNISTTGGNGTALRLNNSDNNTTTLTGNITTTGGSAHGLQVGGIGINTTTITGNISTTGDNSYGVWLINSDSNTTTLTGNISTTGSNAYGLHLYNGDSNIINLTGSLSATGTGAYAIYADSTSDNNTINLTLNQGDRLIGDIVNDGSGNTLNLTLNSGRASSYSYTSSGSAELGWDVTDNSPRPFIIGSAKSRGVADMDDSGNRLYQRLSQINSSLTTQHRELAQGEARGSAWIDTYYTDSDRDTSPAQINQNTRGITVGFNASGDRALAMDVIINYENSDAGYGLSEQIVDSNSLMVGVAFPELMKARNGSLAVKVLAGLSNNDRDLKVLNNLLATGQETVTDKYDSVYVTAGAEWMQPLYKGEHVQHDVLLGMDINHERIEGSTASAYYRLDDRDITQLVGQAQYGVTITGINEKLKINGSVGLAHANIIDGEKQSYTIDGTSVSYRADKSNTYTTASVGARYQLTPQAHAYANVKQFDSTDDIDGTTGNVGLVVRF